MLSRTTAPRRIALSGAVLSTTAVAAIALGVGPAQAHPEPGSTGYPPSPLTTLTGHPHGAGDIFVTPTSAAGTSNGAQIIDPAGGTVWFHQAAPGTVDSDFRAQTVHGKPVLTFWEGKGFGGLSDGTDYIYDSHYRLIARVHAGPGLTTDGHEFLVTDQGTAWVLSYDTATADLSGIGGSAQQTVIDGIVQQIDIRTGRVLFSWNSATHVPYSESEQPLPASPSTPWDWFHVNAVHVDTDGNLLVSARNTWTTYKIDRRSGETVWQLGGKASSFQLAAAPGQTLNNAGDIFAWQHDINGHGDGIYTVFDNESAGTGNTGQGATAQLDHSRAVTIKLDEHSHRATLLSSDNEPDGQLASSQGNAQLLPAGATFVGWGNLNAVSEFDRHGQLIYDARFRSGTNSYRAYLLNWAAASTGNH
jgi:Arylsulfotransferase (ASST)